MSRLSNLPVVKWQAQGNTIFDILSKPQVAIKANGCIQADYANHG